MTLDYRSPHQKRRPNSILQGYGDGYALKLALDGCAHRARILRGPTAKLSPKAADLANRLARRWDPKFDARIASASIYPEDLDPDLFETQQETYLRRYFPPSGSPPN